MFCINKRKNNKVKHTSNIPHLNFDPVFILDFDFFQGEIHYNSKY